MRSARLLLATATATAAFAIAAPGAYAADGGDWEKGDSSHSKEHDKYGKHEKPNGAVHAGGGALTTVNQDDWTKDESKDESKESDSETAKDEESKDWGSKHETEESDSETAKESDSEAAKESDSEAAKEEESKDWGSKHEKPSGGVHTGGGALSLVNEDDWTKDDWTKDESKKSDSETAKGKEGKDWGSGHKKPSGGVHAGGGALAAPGVTAGGLAALAVVGAGAYAMRRRNAADGVS